jgi:hypothetical protein
MPATSKWCHSRSSAAVGRHTTSVVVTAASGASDRLVVRDRGGRRAEVDDEPEVGLVVAHRQRGGRDHRGQLVGLQAVLELGAFLAPEPGGVGGDVVAELGEEAGGALGLRDGQRVDDAGAAGGARAAR